MCNTEMNYVEDLKMVLVGYRDKMERSNLAFLKTELIFGNLDEIWDFHADTLLPQLESCDMNPTLIAKTFLEYCQHLTRMYCRLVLMFADCKVLADCLTVLRQILPEHGECPVRPG